MLREITLRIEQARAEELSDALLAAGALAVSVQDADANSPAEQALYGEPGLEPAAQAWAHNEMQVLLPAASDPTQILASVADALGIETLAIRSNRLLEDTDWVRLTQAQFPPICVAPGFWIVPTWHEPPALTAINLRLDPGAAFGTGTHPTTRLCLQWLVAHPPRAARVLDYGCGSGILAIGAALLGAGEVVGTDIDPLALEAARANAVRNGVAARYTEAGNLPPGVFDLVLANILANPLKVLAPALLARVACGGRLVLSGVLERQATDLIEWYRDLDAAVPLVVAARDDGWVCLAGARA